MSTFYGLPKIHKDPVALRPIVSQINSPTNTLAKYLAKLLFPHSINRESYVKNSYEFVQTIKQLKIQPNDILVSLDIVSLFTNIPVEETLDIIKQKLKLKTDIIDLIDHCMKNTSFSHNLSLIHI